MQSRLPKHGCPHCQKDLDAVTGPGTPRKGDVTVCLYCVGISIATGDDMVLRKPTLEELAELMADPRLRLMVRSVQASILMVKAGRN